MKKTLLTKFLLRSLCTVFLSLIINPLAADLSPPAGPPGPVMKTLEQVEPRIPIDELPFVILESGSYYLVQSLRGPAGVNGIEVDVDGAVTIDLMGHSLYGEEGSLAGISVKEGVVSVRNGFIRDFGGAGIDLAKHVEQVRVLGNRWGIRLRQGSVVRDCLVEGNLEHGILGAVTAMGVVIDATSIQMNGHGLQAGLGSTVRNSVIANNLHTGITLDASSRIADCVVYQNGGDGIVATDGSIIGVQVSLNGGRGIVVRQMEGSSALVTASVVSGNADAGIFIESGWVRGIPEDPWRPHHSGPPVTRIDGNNVTFNRTGVTVTSSGNVILRNSAHGNSEGNFQVAEGNEFGPIGTMEEVGHHPWANFSIE